MHIAIIGAGAIGTLMATYLSPHHQVTIIGRPNHEATLETRPLRVWLPDGRHREARVEVSTDVKGLVRDRAVDMVIVTVKAYDTEAVARHFSSLDSPPYVFTLQNGVGNEEVFAAAVGAYRVLSGAITTPVETLRLGEVRVARASFKLGLAMMQPTDSGQQILQTLGEDLAEEGFRVQYVHDYRALKWSKLLMNITANAQAALLGWPPARVFAHPISGILEVRAWKEALAVMQQLHIHPINFGGYPLAYVAPLIRVLPARWLRPLMGKFVAGGRGDKMPSVYLDLERGKGKTEVPWLNGAVARYGQKVGIKTPVNTTFDALVRAVAEGETAWATFRNRPERILSEVKRREEG